MRLPTLLFSTIPLAVTFFTIHCSHVQRVPEKKVHNEEAVRDKCQVYLHQVIAAIVQQTHPGELEFDVVANHRSRYRR